MVPALDIYSFDLYGYVVLRQALSREEVREVNAGLDAIPRLTPGQWHGHVHGHTYTKSDGLNYQQVYEGGEPFEKLIDHPSWFEHVKTFVGGEGSFDYSHGPLFIDENFANFRLAGEGLGMHSGGNCWSKRNSYRYHNGHFMACQVNVLMALTNIGPGDGGTIVIPASHKQNLEHPHMARHHTSSALASGEGMEFAVEIHLQAGDALVFTDTICHGSAQRKNAGERRIIVYRYGPSWGNFRHGYRVSQELLARLTPQRRQVVHPQKLIPRPGETIGPAHVQQPPAGAKGAY